MERTDELTDWASQEGLTKETIKILKREGFSSLSEVKALTPQEVKECFQEAKLLPLAQCLALKKAVTKLADYHERPRDAERTKYTEHPPERSARGAPCTLPETLQSGSPERFRLLLMGKTGAGKSKTGNTILGRDMFSHDVAFSSVTTNCELKKNTRKETVIELMDAPGLFDTGKTHEAIAIVIVQAVAGMHPGPHAILYVLKVGRYTEEEFAVYQRLKALFDDIMTRYMIVVFTHGDSLEETGKTIDDILESAPSSLKQVLQDCSERYVVFNNKAQNKQPQVERLLDIVRQLVVKNNYRPYSCSKYGAIGQGLEEEVARRMAEVEKRELETKHYVQELKTTTKMAEETLSKERKEFEAKEEDRNRKMKMAEKRYEQEMLQLKETMKEQKITMEQQVKKEQALREKIDEEREEFRQEMEQQRQREMEELKKNKEKFDELEKSMREEREKDRKEMERKMEEEMWKRKEQIVEERQPDFLETFLNVVLKAVPVFVDVFSKLLKDDESEHKY